MVPRFPWFVPNPDVIGKRKARAYANERAIPLNSELIKRR